MFGGSRGGGGLCLSFLRGRGEGRRGRRCGLRRGCPGGGGGRFGMLFLAREMGGKLRWTFLREFGFGGFDGSRDLSGES